MTFDKIYVANRGEIAVRVMRACRERGIRTATGYSDADTDARHTTMADDAIHLPGTSPAETYINLDALLGAIKASGADAVHPGYGFLAENAAFAAAVEDLGLAWIGPDARTIALMGDKISARAAARAAGVRPVPGFDDAINSPDDVLAGAAEVGWPIAIKAAHGGGGRGLKVADDPSRVEATFASAVREAQMYFGRPEVYIERYFPRPRHVEVQIAADRFGNVVSLGTRDCSVQRRHQKLVEEAPAPDLPADIATAMRDAAVAVARDCGYVNVGTVELLFAEGDFYFLEMNTRIQVEHPVTELTAGVDLVGLQIDVADGLPLPFGQDDVECRGHAIECRINAENPDKGRFLPSPGLIEHMSLPGGYGVRVDFGYESGDRVSQFYDNMIGKVAVWGRTRDEARRRMIAALGELDIRGVKTTTPAHLVILEHDDFKHVHHHTRWLETEVDLSTTRI